MTGTLSAHVCVNLTDIYGKAVVKKVSLGKVHCIALEVAQTMVEVARYENAEDHPEVVAVFTINL